MATGSQYHRGATSPHSHYHYHNHNHSYPDLAASWHSSSNGPLSRPPAGSVLLQRFSQPAHRPSAHYLDFGGSSDYVNPSPSQQWPAPYTRHPEHPQPWTTAFHTVPDHQQTFTHARPAQPDHHDHPDSPPFQDTPAQHPDHQRDQTHPSQNSHLHHLPSFVQDTPTLAPILNYANHDIHPAPTWNHMPQTVGSADVASWAMVSSGPHIPSTVAVEQLQQATPMWPVDPDSQQFAHMPQPLADPTYQAPTPTRGRRSLPKKAAAKVPAAFVARQKKSKVSKRKGPLDELGRQKTHNMRKLRSNCLRCRFYKSGCDHGDPCQKCQKSSGGARSFKLGCIRIRLEDATLVRHCNGRSNQEEGEFIGYEWLPNSNLIDMEFIWNLPGTGAIHIHPMRIAVGQYRPKRPLLDATTTEWNTTEGRLIKVEQPPYAVFDPEKMVPAFERYFNSLQPAVEQWIFSRVSHDEIALLTYHEVVRLRSTGPPGQQNLLDLCMRIQCLSIVSQGYGTVWSNDVPGIQEYDYSKMGRSPYEAYDRNSRDRPLPPAISQQIDVTALKLLKKLETACHKIVAAKIFKSTIKPWYELYLALYVIFWNMEYIHRSAETYIMSKNGTTVENHVNNVVSSQLKKWEYSFHNLIQHWHATLRDFLPFKLARENPEELRERGHLDPQGFEYMLKVTRIVDRVGGIGQSTHPYIGHPSTHNSLSSNWIKTLMEAAGI